MILLLDTSTPICELTLVRDDQHYNDKWQAERTLADKLLGYLEEQLQKNNADWRSLAGLVVMKGPGSFTGLRIGITVLNTLAANLNIPIIGETGEDWQEKALARLAAGENDQLVLPEYGREARITTPKK